jgi:hypothetical protein
MNQYLWDFILQILQAIQNMLANLYDVLHLLYFKSRFYKFINIIIT